MSKFIKDFCEEQTVTLVLRLVVVAYREKRGETRLCMHVACAFVGGAHCQTDRDVGFSWQIPSEMNFW